MVNHLLIAANIGVFVWTLASGLFANDAEINRYCFVPNRFLTHVSIQEFSTFFSAMFMHAGFAHLIGNMWYLYIFGDNVEDRFGRWRYAVFLALAAAAVGAGRERQEGRVALHASSFMGLDRRNAPHDSAATTASSSTDMAAATPSCCPTKAVL